VHGRSSAGCLPGQRSTISRIPGGHFAFAATPAAFIGRRRQSRLRHAGPPFLPDCIPDHRRGPSALMRLQLGCRRFARSRSDVESRFGGLPLFARSGRLRSVRRTRRLMPARRRPVRVDGRRRRGAAWRIPACKGISPRSCFWMTPQERRRVRQQARWIMLSATAAANGRLSDHRSTRLWSSSRTTAAGNLYLEP